MIWVEPDRLPGHGPDGRQPDRERMASQYLCAVRCREVPRVPDRGRSQDQECGDLVLLADREEFEPVVEIAQSR